MGLEKSDQFDGSATMNNYDVDHIYTGLNSDIGLRWDNKKYGVKFENSEEIFGYVVYSPPKHDFLCIEPITHLPNVINMDEQAGTMNELEPGDSMSIRHSFVVSEE